MFQQPAYGSAKEGITVTSLDGYLVFASDADFYDVSSGERRLLCQYRRCISEIKAAHDAAYDSILEIAKVPLLLAQWAASVHFLPGCYKGQARKAAGRRVPGALS